MATGMVFARAAEPPVSDAVRRGSKVEADA